jgi:hypothetical protein
MIQRKYTAHGDFVKATEALTFLDIPFKVVAEKNLNSMTHMLQYTVIILDNGGESK